GFRRFTRVRHAGDDINVGGFIETEPERTADRNNRIKDRSLAVRKWTQILQCLRQCDVMAAPNKFCAIRLTGGLAQFRSLNLHEMKHPGWLFTLGARAARAKDGAILSQDFSLDEEIAEGRMGGISRGRSQHHLRVTGQ